MTIEPSTLSFTAEPGRDYEIQARRVRLDPEVRQVAVPQRPVYVQQWQMIIVERPGCPLYPQAGSGD